MKFKYILISSLFFLTYGLRAAQVPETHAVAVREGINLLYNTEYTAALAQFHTLLPEYKDHPAPWFFFSMVYWIKCNDLEDIEASGKEFERYIRLAVEKSESMLALNPEDPHAYFYLAGSLGFQGRYYLFSNQWYQAIVHGLRAYTLLKEAEAKGFADSDIKLGLGIFNYFAARLPGGLANAAKLFGVSGDMQTGLNQLREVVETGQFAAVEAEIMLASIYTYYTKRPAMAVQMFSTLLERYPKNPFFHIALGDALFDSGQRKLAEEKALHNLAMLENGSINSNWSFRIYAQLGKLYYTFNNYPTAMQYLTKALECSYKWPDDYIPWVHLRRAHILRHYKYTQLAEQEYRKVLGSSPSAGAANAARRALEEISKSAEP